MTKIYTGEDGYLQLLADVLNNGVNVPDRTGVGSRAIFDAKWIVGETFPFSTIRPAPLRLAFEEFWFFLNGKTQTKELEEKGCNFWHGNTTREFLDNRGLTWLPEGSIGYAYGSQLRQYGVSTLFKEDMTKDQLWDTHETLHTDKYSRRIYNTMWNPNEGHLMALTPCWHSHQFVVLPDQDGADTLHLKVINRSLDCLFGFSYAVQQYRLYQVAMAKLHGFKLGNMSCDLTQVHLYNNQIEYTKELLTRETGQAGTVEITKDLHSLHDLLTMTWEDIKVEDLIVNTDQFATPRPPMAA